MEGFFRGRGGSLTYQKSLSTSAGNRYWFGLNSFQTIFNILGVVQSQVLLIPGSAALDTLDINAIDIAFQREVSPAPFAGFGSDYTEHYSP